MRKRSVIPEKIRDNGKLVAKRCQAEYIEEMDKTLLEVFWVIDCPYECRYSFKPDSFDIKILFERDVIFVNELIDDLPCNGIYTGTAGGTVK